MKTFTKLKTHDEAVNGLKEQGWELDYELYDSGDDWVNLTNKYDTMRISWSPFNGHFYGVTIAGTKFNHTSDNLDDEPWYQEILKLFFEGGGNCAN